MSALNHDQALLAIAHHEAGHAVVAAHLGIPVTSLNLNNRTGTDGSWYVDGITYVTYTPTMANAFVAQAAAGELAALRWLDDHHLRSPETLRLINADHDRDEALELLAQDGIHLDWDQARKQADTLVNSLWPQISAVAYAAYQNLSLTGTQIDDLARWRTAWGFRQCHGLTDGWSKDDFESFENLAHNDQMHRTNNYQSAA